MNNNKYHSDTIKLMLESEFVSHFGNESLNWNEKYSIISQLFKMNKLPNRMRILFIAFNYGSYELTRYIKRNLNCMKKYAENLAMLYDIKSEMHFLESDF